MMVLAELWLVLNTLFQVSLIIQNPSKDGVLNFLVIFFLKEIVMEELHRTDEEKLASFQTHVESTNGPIRRERNWSTGQQRITWFPDVDGGSVWIYELEPTVFIPVCQLILGIPVLLGVLTRLILFRFSRAGCCSIKNRMFKKLNDMRSLT